MGQKKHLNQLRNFKRELSKHIPVQRLILFGSQASGRSTRWSDFDLIVVSPSFRRKQSLVRSLGFYKYWHLNHPVDFLCYTPEEFQRLSKRITIVKEAVEKGVEI